MTIMSPTIIIVGRFDAKRRTRYPLRDVFCRTDAGKFHDYASVFECLLMKELALTPEVLTSDYLT